VFGIGGRMNSDSPKPRPENSGGCLRQFGIRDAADQVRGELLGGHFVEPGTDHVGRDRAKGIRRDTAIQHETASLRHFKRLCEHVVEFEHLDAALLHLEHEVVMILLRLVNQMTSSNSRSLQFPGVRR